MLRHMMPIWAARMIRICPTCGNPKVYNQSRKPRLYEYHSYIAQFKQLDQQLARCEDGQLKFQKVRDEQDTWDQGYMCWESLRVVQVFKIQLQTAGLLFRPRLRDKNSTVTFSKNASIVYGKMGILGRNYKLNIKK